MLKIETDTGELVIDYNDPKLETLLSDLFEISCIELIKFALSQKEISSQNQIKLIYKIKNKLISYIKEMMFAECDGENKQLTLQNLQNLFINFYEDSV